MMHDRSDRRPVENTPDVPSGFFGYVRSMGPGLIVVLTWLGAGDIVQNGVSGGNYGYALMWVIVLAVIMRFLFVSLIAKYQLCNQYGENVVDGLARLHAWYPPFLAFAAFVFAHVLGSYMLAGLGEASVNLTGLGINSAWGAFCWALLWSAAALLLVFRPVYRRIELVFKCLLGVLTASFIGIAVWVRPNPVGIFQGTFAFALPPRHGPYDSLLVAVALIGAVGGSLMNLMYPFLLEQKGWRGPTFRRLQIYDLLFGIVVLIVLDLAIWTLGAELIRGRGGTIEEFKDLAELLSIQLGQLGESVFYLGIMATLFTSLAGQSLGLAWLGSFSYLRWKKGTSPGRDEYTTHPTYKFIAVWGVVSPLVWSLPGTPDFMTLTLLGNGIQVFLIPVLAGGLWVITSSRRFIGEEYRNSWWENLVMALLFVIAVWSAFGMLQLLVKF